MPCFWRVWQRTWSIQYLLLTVRVHAYLLRLIWVSPPPFWVHSAHTVCVNPPCLCPSPTFPPPVLQLDWLRSLLLSGKADAFKHIPEYALSAPLTWLEFVIRGGQAVLVASKPIGKQRSGPGQQGEGF